MLLTTLCWIICFDKTWVRRFVQPLLSLAWRLRHRTALLWWVRQANITWWCPVCFRTAFHLHLMLLEGNGKLDFFGSSICVNEQADFQQPSKEAGRSIWDSLQDDCFGEGLSDVANCEEQTARTGYWKLLDWALFELTCVPFPVSFFWAVSIRHIFLIGGNQFGEL